MTSPVDSSNPCPCSEKVPKRSEDSLLEIILLITVVAVAFLFIQEVRPEWISRWMSLPASSDIEALSDAIIQQESHGNASSVNPDSGALGYAQIMPENLPEWSRQALGYEITPEVFLSRPDLQHQIIQHRLALYWQNALQASHGNKEQAIKMVASQWYSGDPYLYQSTQTQFYNGQTYPSIAEYSESVLQNWKQRRPGHFFNFPGQSSQ
jgi:hypothetical protein